MPEAVWFKWFYLPIVQRIPPNLSWPILCKKARMIWRTLIWIHSYVAFFQSCHPSTCRITWWQDDNSDESLWVLTQNVGTLCFNIALPTVYFLPLRTWSQRTFITKNWGVEALYIGYFWNPLKRCCSVLSQQLTRNYDYFFVCPWTNRLSDDSNV